MTEDTGDLRLAVWGAGVMGERVAQTASRIPGLVVTSVIDRDINRALKVAQGVDASAAQNLNEALSKNGFDAVYIGLPNASHHDACVEAAIANLHVLVDKPLTSSLPTADDVLSHASASDRYWMMGFSSRFRAEWQSARNIVLSGQIGEPYFVSDTVIEAYHATPPWYFEQSAGGGTLWLQSHHVFDRWEWMLGREITELCAGILSPSGVAGVSADLSVSLTARFGPAVLGSSAMSFGVGYDSEPRVSFTLQATEGMVEIDLSRRLRVATHGGVVDQVFDNDWLYDELSTFLGGVRGHDHGQPGLEEGRRAVLLADAADRSAREQVWVKTSSEGWPGR